MGVTNVPVVVALLLAALARHPQGGAPCTSPPAAEVVSAAPLPPFLGNCTLTDDVSAALSSSAETDGHLDRALAAFRLLRPELYAATPPPNRPPRSPGEFEPAESLYVAYHPWPAYAGTYGDIIESAARQGAVRVILHPEDRPALEALLAERAVPASRVALIDDVPHESVWIRDYGPIPIETAEGLGVVDPSYFANCPHDDAVPARLAAAGRVGRIYRHGLRLEGGNLISNGRGLCLTTVGLLAANGLDEATAAETLRRYHGCDRTLFLLPLAGDVVDHVDMFAAFADEETLLIGEYAAEQDLLNRLILEQDTALVRQATANGPEPLRVVRVPMPDNAAPVEGAPAVIVRSYLNLTIFNGVVLVPVFDSDPGVEAAAFAALAEVFPGRELVPVPADAAADDGGGIHCLTRAIPRVPSPPASGAGTPPGPEPLLY